MQRESSAASDGASTVGARLDELGGELGQLASTTDTLLRAGQPVASPRSRSAAAPRLVSAGTPAAATLIGSQSKLLAPTGQVADPLGASRPQIAAALAAFLTHHPEVSAIWLYDSTTPSSPRCR